MKTSARSTTRRSAARPSALFVFTARPRLLRFIIAKAAESPSTALPKRRVSSPPGTRSTLITSAPMSARSCPQVGAAMMWLISTTFRPCSRPAFPLSVIFGFPSFTFSESPRPEPVEGRGYALMLRQAQHEGLSVPALPPLELGLLLGEEGLVADVEILGVEAGEALRLLRLAQRRPAGEDPVDEFLVPAVDERGTVGDPPGRRVGLVLDLVVLDHPVDQALLHRLHRIEDARLVEDLQRPRAAHQPDQRLDLGARKSDA